MPKARINECGHPERKHAGRGMCAACYQKATYDGNTQKEYSRKWREENPEVYDKWRKARVEKAKEDWKNPVKRRILQSRIYKRNFGITIDDYERMLETQKYVCAACGQPESTKGNNGKIKRLAVDHDHTTEAVRGLLCTKCNTILGFVNDDVVVLGNIINYLQSAYAYQAVCNN